MSSNQPEKSQKAPKNARFSTDVLAVTLALLAALLVRIGVIRHVPW
jgi:hypothetical protein